MSTKQRKACERWTVLKIQKPGAREGGVARGLQTYADGKNGPLRRQDETRHLSIGSENS